jgi:hypothetical protein
MSRQIKKDVITLGNEPKIVNPIIKEGPLQIVCQVRG